MDQPITPFDLERMLLGEHPALFYAEIVVRTLIIYAYTLLMVRWIGGRGVSQLSLVEFVLVIALGSAVGDSMFYPEVPLLYGIAVITLVIGANKALDALIQHSDRAKNVIDGRPIALVRDGRLLPEGMAAAAIGAAEAKAMLRLEGVENLGEVRAAFLEAGGGMSLFRRSRPRPGLALVPPGDVVPPQPGKVRAAAPGGPGCCCHCGAVSVHSSGSCTHCGGATWVVPELAGDDGASDDKGAERNR